MGFIWLLVALGMIAAARFCVQPARTYRAWWVALVATELGHVWAPVALGVGVAGAFAGGAAGWAAAGVAAVAATLFARPVWSAWRMSGRDEEQLQRVFGGGPESLWSWRRLGWWPLRAVRGPVETYDVSGLPMDFYRARTAGGDPAKCNQFGYTLPLTESCGGGGECVVLVHGGGWDSGDRAQLAAFNHWLAGHGVAVAAVSYRLAPTHPWPAQRDDVRAAVAWVRANAEKLGVDGERLTLMGRSAGAQIAAATAYGEKLPGVRALVALYGCHDLEFVWSIRSAKDALNSDKLMQQFMGGPPEGEGQSERYRTGSAERLVHVGAPPTLIIHGALDELVWCRHSERLTAALERVGVPVAFLRLPWATHACDANLHGPAGQLITGAVLRAAMFKNAV